MSAASNPAGEGTGTNPSPAGRTCDVDGCDRAPCAKGLCKAHWTRYQTGSTKTGPVGEQAVLVDDVFVACPDNLIPLVTKAVENDAHPIAAHLWRAAWLTGGFTDLPPAA